MSYHFGKCIFKPKEVLKMKKIIKNIFQKMGLQISKYQSYELPSTLDVDLLRRQKIMNYFGINTVFDIGANNGHYSTTLREYGYSKKIISFEPLKQPFEELKNVSENDDNWLVNNYAIGNADCIGIINVAKNSLSSSLLKMLPAHLNSAPESEYISKQEIKIKKLDTIFNSFCCDNDKVLLKIDTQGFEKNVIDGAVNCLKNIAIIQLEMSIIPLYENEMLFNDMMKYIESKGFELYSLENGFADQTTGRLLQIDGIFVKKSN